MKTSNVRVVTVVAVIMLAGHARAQMVVADTFTGASSVLQWRPMAGACLTAGNGTGTIPACKGLPYYQGKDPEYDWYKDADHDGVVCER